jgi:hypothetical protein
VKGRFRTLLILAAVLLVPVMARSQSLFGNTPVTSATPFDIESGAPYNESEGFAVAFTPSVDFTISSITLCLSNYTQSFAVQLWEQEPAPYYYDVICQLGGPPPNDGSQDEFTYTTLTLFTDVPTPVTLDAGQNYYLVAYSAEDQTSTEPIDWVGGTTPSGDAVFDGTYSVYEGILGPNAVTSNSPAFSLNPVPEPSAISLGLLAIASLPFARRRTK